MVLGCVGKSVVLWLMCLVGSSFTSGLCQGGVRFLARQSPVLTCKCMADLALFLYFRRGYSEFLSFCLIIFLNSYPQVQDLLKDPCFDKLSVVAMETIMMSHICFPRDADDYEQVTIRACLHTVRTEL